MLHSHSIGLNNIYFKYKFNKVRLRCTEVISNDELISSASYQNVTLPLKSIFARIKNDAKFTRNHFRVIFCYFINILCVFKQNKRALFNQNTIFSFLTSILRYQRFMSFKKTLSLIQLFSPCMMFGMYFDNVSFR